MIYYQIMAKVINTKIYIIVISLILVLISCKQKKEENTEIAVAIADGESLYWEDIEKDMPKNLSPDDSIIFINNYINNWATEQLLFSRAKQQLRDTADIEEMINDYRKQLYIHKYKQEKIFNELDFNVSNAEVEDYYNKNLKDFVLNQAYVKAHYLTMSSLVTTYYQERNIVLATEAGDHQKLIDFTAGTGRRVYFHDDWIKLSDFLLKINYQEDFNPERLRNEKLIENTDFNLRYLAKINDYKLKGDIAPIELVESAIIDIIINNRRQSVYSQYVKSLIIEAENNGDFKNKFSPVYPENIEEEVSTHEEEAFNSEYDLSADEDTLDLEPNIVDTVPENQEADKDLEPEN
jgi:hypothetical protein